MSRLQDAELRPPGGVFEMQEHTVGNRSRASLIVPAESRLTFTLPVPRRARLRFHAAIPDAGAGAAVSFRVGISDDRIYRTLVEQTITSADSAARGWSEIVADLSPFAGPKLSLFYRPDGRRWRLILGTHVISGSPRVAYLAEPTIETDVDSAREYMKRRASMSR